MPPVSTPAFSRSAAAADAARARHDREGGGAAAAATAAPPQPPQQPLQQPRCRRRITVKVVVAKWLLIKGKSCLAEYLVHLDPQHRTHAAAARTAPAILAAEPVTAALMLLARLGHVSGEAPLDEGVRGLQSIYSAMIAPTVPEPEPASHLQQYVK